MGKTWSHWLLEGVFIVLSVGLAFTVGQCRESRSNHELAGRVLRSLQAEVEHNLALVEPLQPIHERWANALDDADTSDATKGGFDYYFSLRPELPPNSKSAFAFPRRSAWDAAQSGGALRLLDYDLVATLSDIYSTQERASNNLERLSMTASSPLVFDPVNRKASVRVLWLVIADVASTEAVLLDLYRQGLPAIRAAAKAEP
jgi:hypothetical protein